MKKINLFIVRHGETFLNKLGRNQGWIDSDLTKEGVSNLDDIYSNLDLPVMDAVFCSDLNRAKATFKIIQKYCDLNQNNIFYTKLLRERFLGSFEGHDLAETRKIIAQKEGFSSYNDLITNKSLAHFIDSTKKYDPNNFAEDFKEFSERLNQVLSTIKKQANENNWEDILIVSHANSVSYIVDTLVNNREFIFGESKVENGQLIHLHYNLDKWQIKTEYLK